MEHASNGILLIDKDEGETSFGVVRKIRSVFGGFRVQKVGHAGTLDPFATGLLIILLGQGTKLSQFIMSEGKVYLATLRLGVETDTLDSTGRILATSVIPDLSLKYIQEKAKGFVGDIEQVPPAYSAVKYGGTRAYKLARRGIKMDLKKKKVKVHSLRILSVSLPDVTMEIRCSRGTYVRTIGADLGTELGPGGHLRSLRRLTIGVFETKNALESKEIPAKENRYLLKEKVILLRDALPGMPEIEIESRFAKKVRHGYQPIWEDLDKGLNSNGYQHGYIKLIADDELVAIVKSKKSRGICNGSLKVERVFL